MNQKERKKKAQNYFKFASLLIHSGSFEVRNSESFVEVMMMGCRWKNGKGNR